LTALSDQEESSLRRYFEPVPLAAGNGRDPAATSGVAASRVGL
jgi:hypothetical protein